MSAQHAGPRRVVAFLAIVLLAPLLGLAAAGPVGATTPIGPFTVELRNREEARRFYYAVHQSSEGVDAGWTGNVARCEPGTVSAEFLEATLTRINWFRAMAGVASDIVFTAENNATAQATALMMSAQGDTSHEPPPDWRCWTQQAARGAVGANLTIGSTGPAAIDQLMKDTTAVELGHRRGILNPQHLAMGSGSVPDHAGGSATEAQFMQDNPSPVPRPARDGFVAWPPPGFVPYQTVYPAWSFVLRGADFANATVTMNRNGAAVPARITTRADFAGPGIVWLADGLAQNGTWPRPTADDRITVTVGNVVVDGVARAFTYDVTVFDPTLADPARTPLRITGPDAPPAGAVATYDANPIPNATGYQWRTTKLTPLAEIDGAEAGLVNFDAVVDDYDPVSTAFAATGTASFRLTIGQTERAPASGTETLTFKRTIVPDAGSRLTFKARAIRLANVRATVQASVDGGAWTTIFTESSTDDATFGGRSVPLGGFAGTLVRLRFHAESAGTGNWGCCGSEGWYLDDIAVSDAFAGVATIAAVGPDPTITVTPTDGLPLNVEVRAVFFGSGPGEWSPIKRITPLLPPVAPVGAAGLAGAIDTTLTASGSGDVAWAPQTALSHDGVDAARSGVITHNQRSTLQVAAVQGPATVSFWWKVDSEARFDFLTVELDGAQPFTGISGNIDWQQRTIDVPAGQHTLQWHYTKDESVSERQDAAWIDQLTIA